MWYLIFPITTSIFISIPPVIQILSQALQSYFPQGVENEARNLEYIENCINSVKSKIPVADFDRPSLALILKAMEFSSVSYHLNFLYIIGLLACTPVSWAGLALVVLCAALPMILRPSYTIMSKMIPSSPWLAGLATACLTIIGELLVIPGQIIDAILHPINTTRDILHNWKIAALGCVFILDKMILPLRKCISKNAQPWIPYIKTPETPPLSSMPESAAKVPEQTAQPTQGTTQNVQKSKTYCASVQNSISTGINYISTCGRKPRMAS